MAKFPNSHKIRTGRASLPGQVYLVTAVTDCRTRIFEDFELGCLASKTLSRREHWPDARLLAWVLMPDHMHLLVALGDAEELSLVIQRVKSAISRVLRPALDGRRLWQAGFHDHALRSDEVTRHVARYIIANPLRAGFVKRVGDYPFWDAVWLDASSNPLDI